MKEQEVFEAMAAHGIVPVIAIESKEQAVPLADALIAGGLPVAEVTFRTKAAAEVMALLRKERPGILLGAGTVLTPENAKLAKECGAAFAVSPGLNPKVVREARKAGLAFAPGVMTPTDIEAALDMGLKVLKYFPAGTMGGLSAIKSVCAPYAHTGVRFIPTGGVTQDNLGEYLAEKTILAVGGTWIAKKADISAGNWSRISENCRKACETAGAVRPRA